MSLVSKIYLSLVSCLLLVSCARAGGLGLEAGQEAEEVVKEFKPVQAVPQITPGPGPIAPPVPVQEELVPSSVPQEGIEQPPIQGSALPPVPKSALKKTVPQTESMQGPTPPVTKKALAL